MSETIWEWPHLKGGDAWKEYLLDSTTNYNLNTRRIIMKKQNKEVVSPLSKVVNNNVDDNINSNKEEVMKNETVTLSREEYEKLVAKKAPGKPATTCSKQWKCTMKRSEIVLSGATPQMQRIMNCVAQEAKENPDVEYHKSDAIVKRLMDPENPDAMTFSKTYRDASEEVRLVRLIKVMNYYAHPDFREEMTDEKFDVR